MRVAAPPYKSHSVMMFARLITHQHHFLKDFIQIMKLDLVSVILYKFCKYRLVDKRDEIVVFCHKL